MVKIYDDGKGQRQLVEASMTDVDLSARVNDGYGASEPEAAADLRRRVPAYRARLHALNFAAVNRSAAERNATQRNALGSAPGRY
ncbi:MAG: hypothetical protein ACRYG7_06405 [Janthinobacterium lividum]